MFETLQLLPESVYLLPELCEISIVVQDETSGGILFGDALLRDTLAGVGLESEALVSR
jgi:hypothetical protein